MSRKRLLMCPPDYFDIEYSINPWMDVKNKVNKEKAFAQYEELKTSFKNVGAEVYELTPIKKLPDMIYATNAGYAGNNIFIKANFKAEQRKYEADEAEKFFKRKNYDLVYFPENITFEGEGDLIRSDTKFFLGYGSRTDLKAAEFISKKIGEKVIPLELINPYFYHLDTCFGPINDELVIINENAFSEISLNKIYDNFNNVITTNSNDNSVLGCNIIVIGKNVFIGEGISEELKDKIINFGYFINEIDMSEFLKGGGSIKCLTLEIY